MNTKKGLALACTALAILFFATVYGFSTVSNRGPENTGRSTRLQNANFDPKIKAAAQKACKKFEGNPAKLKSCIDAQIRKNRK